MKYRLSIDGMSCGHCAAHVTEALTEMGGKNVSVDLNAKCAFAEFDAAVAEDAFRSAIDDAGYDFISVSEQ